MTPDPDLPTPLRVGIAGYGLAGAVFHAPLVAAVDGLEVAAVVTGDAERADRARAAYPGVHVAAHVDELWERIDVLVVATPNRHHAELALAAIAHDVPVVIDKPMASSVEEAERVLAAGGRVTVFQNRRWDGDFLTARALLAKDALGEVVRFESRFERYRPQVGEGWRERGGAQEGGGQLLDLGSHLVDQAIVLFGPPLRVYAEVDHRRPGAEVDDDVFLALEHAGGVRSHLWMGVLAPLAGPRFRLSGRGGGFAVDGLDVQEPQLIDGLRPGDAGYGEREPGRIVDAQGEREQPLERGAYEQFYVGVRDWVRGGADAPPPVDPHDSLTVLRVLEAARRSAEAHEVVALS